MNPFARARHLAFQRVIHAQNGTTPNKNRTLVIIDMQSGFMDIDEHEIVPAICSLVRHAIENTWGILVVEFEHYGNTDSNIIMQLDGYPHWKTVYKSNCDGGPEILQKIESSPNWSLDMVVCGIYGPECVSATVEGLLTESNLTEVDIAEEAVYPDYLPYSSEVRARIVSLDDIIHCKTSTSNTAVYPVCKGE